MEGSNGIKQTEMGKEEGKDRGKWKERGGKWRKNEKKAQRRHQQGNPANAGAVPYAYTYDYSPEKSEGNEKHRLGPGPESIF